MWLHVPLVPTPPTPMHPACASKSRDLFSLTLHSRALSYLPMPLFGSSRLCRGFLLHFSDSFIHDSLVPFSTIHLPHLVRFLIPIYITGTSHFTFIRGPMLLSFNPILYLASFTVSPFVLSFRLRPFLVYNPWVDICVTQAWLDS